MNANLISLCRYYKGEKKCPFTDERENLWFYEKTWIDMNEAKESFEEMITDYVSRGLTSFEEYDDVPIALKALLWERFVHWIGVDPDAFKTWYVETYKKGSR